MADIEREAEEDRRAASDKKRQRADGLWGDKRKRGGSVKGCAPASRPDKRARGGRLDAAQRQAMPKSDFALPGKGSGKKGAGAGSYPIPDESHARNALARGSQHASPAEYAEIRRKVHAKYPQIQVSGAKKD
jgi:hypothetical protein